MFDLTSGPSVPLPAQPALAYEIRALIEQAKIISFDVFDTLLVRPFHSATDVFLIIERRSGVAGFQEVRIRAEALARDRLAREIGSGEVTLSEIYECLVLPMAAKQGWTAQALMQLEMETELSVLVRSPGVAPLYEAAVQSGKPVIAVSDMYLSEALIGQALDRSGIKVERIFLSCVYRRSKHEATLYEDIRAAYDVAPHEILHFGDNYAADCATALRAGLSGYHIPSLRDQLLRDSRYNQRAMRQLTDACSGNLGAETNLLASVMLGYLAQFKAAQPCASIAAIFGAMYAGPLVTGFAYWLDLMMRTDRVLHLRLLTRDGYVTKDIWERLGLVGEASVLHSSRRLTLMPALVHDFEKEVASLLASSTTITLRECISRLNLADDSELIAALGRLTLMDQPVDSPRKVEAALRALRDCESVLRRLASAELEAYKSYLAAEGVDPDADAIADCGWALSSQRRMEGFLEQKLRGYYIGSLAHAHSHPAIRCFLFTQGKHRGWANIAERAVELLELPFASLEAQVCRFTMADGAPVAVPVAHEQQYEMVRAAFIKRMHQESSSFADFIRPVLAQITVEEFREVLFILFDALVKHPTSFEYHELAGLPHNREYGKSEFATIGTFWRIAGPMGYVSPAGQSRWRDYLRIGWLSMRQTGMHVTWMRVKRVLRRKLRGG